MIAFPLIALLLVSPQIPLHVSAQYQFCVFQRGVVDQVVERGAMADGLGVLVLDAIAVYGQHGAVGILQLHAACVHVELAEYQFLHDAFRHIFIMTCAYRVCGWFGNHR